MGKMKTRRILVMLNQTLKAARDEISGILRAASGRPELEVRIFDRNITPVLLRERIASWIPDGIVTDNRGTVPTILPGAKPGSISIKLGKDRNIPVVYLDYTCRNAASVIVDNSDIGKTAAEFLLKRKYQSFAFVGTNLAHTAHHSEMRETAFSTRVAQDGFTCARFLLNESIGSAWADELERLGSWIRDLPKPCGILAHADVYARLVADACRLVKIGIPEQVVLIGVDNETDITDNMRPTLTSVLPDFENGGALALSVLMKRIGCKGRRLRATCTTYGVKTLIERESTQDTRGAGRLVDSARSLIRRRFREGIRVADIARELNVSPRLIELHFAKVLGHSIRDEILELRLSDVKHHLSRTKEPIDAIALQCGWRTPIALKILFKKRYGMSMRDYRTSTKHQT